MISIQLNRSGGLLGKTLRSIKQVDMLESEILKTLSQVAPTANPHERDAFHYSITINAGETFPVDVAKLKGDLRKLVAELEGELKV